MSKHAKTAFSLAVPTSEKKTQAHCREFPNAAVAFFSLMNQVIYTQIGCLLYVYLCLNFKLLTEGEGNGPLS